MILCSIPVAKGLPCTDLVLDSYSWLHLQVQQKSEEVAEAHSRNKEVEADLRAQANDIAERQADLADALRQAPDQPLAACHAISS